MLTIFAAFSFHHAFQDCAGTTESTSQIDSKHLIPKHFRGIDKELSLIPSCIVYENVDGTKFVRGCALRPPRFP